MPEILLAIDVGSTTLRTLLTDLEGKVIAIARAKTEPSYPAPGRVEQDANKLWQRVHGLINEVLAQSGLKPEDIASIGVTTQRTSIVIWDQTSGDAVIPMILWSDLRGIDRAKDLAAAGYIAAAQLASAKLENAFKDAETVTGSKVFGNDAPALRWGNIDAFIISKLTSGKSHISDASQMWATGYLDLATFELNKDLMSFQNLSPELFPTLTNTWGNLAVTSKAVFGAEVPIGAVVADQQSAMFAHNCMTPGSSKITYGTSGTLNVCTGAELKLISESVMPFVQYKNAANPFFCLEGMIITAGTTLDWLVDDLQLLSSITEVSELAAQVPDSEGVWVLPSLLGVGAPHIDNERRMEIGGLSRGSKKAHVVRATLEGIAYRVREIFDHIYDLAEVPKPESIGVDGGAAASDTLLQIQANVLGIPIKRHSIGEATALGAAICAGMGAGLIKEQAFDSFAQYSDIFEPETPTASSQGGYEKWKSRVYHQ